MTKANIEIALIKKEYFKKNKDFVNMLDYDDHDKQSRRLYLSLIVHYKNNKFLIPLRTNLGEPARKFGVIGYSVPSSSRPKAGLDYRYMLIVNDSAYLEIQENVNISRSQIQKIKNDYTVIENEAQKYIDGYIKAAAKNRVDREPKYRVSSLCNFDKELEVLALKALRKEKKEKAI